MPPKEDHPPVTLKLVRAELYKANSSLLTDIKEAVDSISQKVDVLSQHIHDEMSGNSKKFEDITNLIENRSTSVGNKLDAVLKQVNSLSDSCGSIIEAFARKEVQSLASRNVEPFYLHFTSAAECASVFWVDITDVFRYLGLHQQEEARILRRLFKSLRIGLIRNFLCSLQSTLTMSLNIDQIFESNEVHTLEDWFVLLQNLKQQFGKSLPLISRLVVPVLRFMRHVRMCVTSKELYHKLLVLPVSEMEQFLMMFLVWWTTKKILSGLEIDIVGSVVRGKEKGKDVFNVSMAEVKSSRSQIPDAKQQLDRTFLVISKLLSKLSGKALLQSCKVIMVHKVDAEYRVDEGGYLVVGFQKC